MPSSYPPPPHYRIFPRNSGVAIGPILFIVAILAILAAAIAAGTGAFTGGTTNEQASVIASTVMQIGEAYRSAFELVISRTGASENPINASNPGFFSPLIEYSMNGCYGVTSTMSETDSAGLYSISGGGMQPPTYLPPLDSGATPIYPTGWRVVYTDIPGLGQSSFSQTDYLAMVQVSQATCLAILKNLGQGTTIPAAVLGSWDICSSSVATTRAFFE